MLFGKRQRLVKTILIVEDEPLTAFENELMLGAEGYEVVGTVDSVGEALSRIEQARPDLILTDVNLRGHRTGEDLARLALDMEIPLMFLTGNPPDTAPKLSIACLAKPYSSRALKAALAAVEDALTGQTLRRVPAGLTLYDPPPFALRGKEE